MELNNSIKVKNYKCFGDEPQGFEKIMPINVIIGKNNSGKSSLIELVRFLSTRTTPQRFFLVENDKTKPSIEITQNINYILDSLDTGWHILATRIKTDNPVKLVINNNTNENNTNIEFDSDFNWDSITSQQRESLTNLFKHYTRLPFFDSTFKKITAERDIVKEAGNEMLIKDNGEGATRYIQKIVTDSSFRKNIVKRQLLDDLNKIINPDIKFRDITPRRINESDWEIFFDDDFDNEIALSKMGSGIKTVLLVLLNLIAIPQIENKPPSNYVFAFEELENNLHPSLLRRLFSYIIEYSRNNQAVFFITTHSNVVIDLFGDKENSQILHVYKDKQFSKVDTVLSNAQNKNILKDLDIRASDLLQSNGIIWVEGPSDRVYINKWLSTLAPELQEGTHYSIMFYGDRLLSNLSLDDPDWYSKQVVPLIKINSNAFLIMDRDGNSENAELNETKQRLKREFGDCCWTTKGREIENYLSPRILNQWLSEIHEILDAVEHSVDEKLENTILALRGDIKLKYNRHKKEYSLQISEYFKDEDLDVLDLKPQLETLIKTIKDWNSIS